MQNGAPTFFLHPGDVRWWLYYPPLSESASQRVYLWDNPTKPEEALGIVFIDHDEFTCFVHPAGDDEQKAMIRSWAQQECTTLARQAGKQRIFSGFVSDQDAALIGYYQQSGFGHDPSSDYVCFLHKLQNLQQHSLPEGFFFSDMGAGTPVLSRAQAQYAAFQSRAAWEAYAERYQRFAKSPVYSPELDQIVLSPDGQVAAFCINWLDAETKIALFEPVGVHPDFQKRGLGKALLSHALIRLKENGMKQAIVQTEYNNAAAIALYRTVGFQQIDRLLLFSKAIELMPA
jgi:ribosomal protein S18 acetylase RimI-like enzyme